MKKSLILFLALFFGCMPLSSARAADSLLKILVVPDQTTVKPGMMFLVNVGVENSSTDTSTEFWANSCSYEKHWVTDLSEVSIQSWTCNENALEPIKLEPGSSYQKNIILYISGKNKEESVTFRLGFSRMSENGDVAEPLWSDPVTIYVTVPGDAGEALSDADTGETNEEAPSGTVQAGAPGPVAPVVNQPLVFQDPGVPITVAPGQEFSISLASNPSTGFRWKMTLPENEQTVTFLGSEHAVSGEVMPGVPGQEVFKFRASTQGETKAAFVYERPWEPKVAPTRKIFTILVQEN